MKNVRVLLLFSITVIIFCVFYYFYVNKFVFEQMTPANKLNLALIINNPSLDDTQKLNMINQLNLTDEKYVNILNDANSKEHDKILKLQGIISGQLSTFLTG